MDSNENEQHQGSRSGPREKLDRILSTLRGMHKKLRRRRNLLLLFAPLSLLFVGATFLFYVESFMYIPAAGKSLCWGVLLTVTGGLAWYLRQRFPVPDFTRFYRELTYQTGLPKLQHALDLQRFPRHDSSVFRRAAINENIADVEEEDLAHRYRQYLQYRPENFYYQYGLGSFLLSTALLLLAMISIDDGINRGLQFWHGFDPPNPYEFTIEPGDQTIEQGSSFTPTIRFEGEDRPSQVTLGIKTNIESDYRLRPMRPEGEQSFVTRPITLTSDAQYYVKMGDYESDRYAVRVQLRPRFSELKAVVRPPEYTGLDSSHATYPFSRLEAYPGSEITLRGVSNKPLSALYLNHTAGPRDTLTPEESGATVYRHRFTVNAPDTLQFTMRDSTGLTNKNPFQFSIKPQQDERPFVRILQPDSALKESNPDSLTLVYEGGDDFGLISTGLHYEHHEAFADEPERERLEIPTPSSDDTQVYTWDLTDLQLKPRDKIVYWISVTDNDAVSGYKSVNSRKMTLTVPSMSEYAEELQEKEKDVEQTLDDVSQSYQQMSDEYEQFKEQMKRDPTGNWEQQQKLEEVQKKRQEFQEKTEELNEKFNKVKEELEKNEMLSDETQQAYEELQKLMKEIEDPELREALEELQKAVEEMDQNKLKKSLEDFEFQEESYREQLERTIDLFKKLKTNSNLEKMAKSLESLSEQEKELSESDTPASGKIDKQQAIKEDAEQMSSQIDSLADQAPGDAKQQMKQLEKEAREQMESLQKQLEQNMQEMKNNGNSSKSRSQQQQMQKQMQKMAGKMRQSKSNMNQKRMQVNIEALQHILYSLVNLSENQEELSRDTENIESGSRAFVELARTQKNIARQFNHISDSLTAVASDIPMVSSSVMRMKNELGQRLDRSVDQLDERNKNNATMAERQVLGGINELSSMVASLIDQLKKMAQKGQGSGSGNMSMQQMKQKMKEMSGKQRQLSKMMEKMMNQMQGDRLSKNQIERMKQMARQQNEIRKQLQQMREEGNFEPGDKLMSQMERINEEMEQTVRDLRGGENNRKLLKRQENILSRMLNAQDAMNKRDKSDERKARQPEETHEQTSPQMTMEELQKKIRQRMQDPEFTKFSDDYQQLIEAYFELIKAR